MLEREGPASGHDDPAPGNASQGEPALYEPTLLEPGLFEPVLYEPGLDELGLSEPQSDEPELVLMRRMVELSMQRSRMAADRSRMSAQRSRMSAERSRMSADRSRMSADRSRMSADRSEMSAERSYMNSERTLSVWIRTALAMMVAGIAIDRFGLVLLQQPGEGTETSTASVWVGAGLVAFGVLMAVVTSIRFGRYAADYCRTHTLPHHHGPFMAPAFGVLVAVFGAIVLILLLAGPD